MATKKNVTIKDIAKMSGVSAGTVDRVLHNRGKVSEDAFQKVIKVLNEINYKPNLIARSLGAKRNYHIAVIVPMPEQDQYWKLCNAGIILAQLEWSQYGIIIDTFYFDLYDKQSYINIANEAHSTNPDAILTAPIFYNEALPFFEKYATEDIPYVLFNTNIPNINPLSFIGQDLHQSGKVGAELLHFGQNLPGTYIILHLYEDSHNGIHLVEKEKGFRDYFTELSDPGIHVSTWDLSSESELGTEGQIQKLLETTDLRGIFVSTSIGTTIMAKYLKQFGKKSVRLVGYDLLEENLQYMQGGVIDFLINQNPKRQGFVGVAHLANYLLFKKEVPALSLFPLEVITKQNLKSYLETRLN